MKRLSYVAILVFVLLDICGTLPTTTEGKENGFLSVPPELADLDWKRTPLAVLNNPVKDEPLIWLGIVRKVDVTQKDQKIEIEWLCEHLSFVETGPAAIGKRPIRAKAGKGFFALSLILDNMRIEQALKFKAEHTASPHYILVGGKFHGIVEREGRQVPFLYTLRFGMGPKLAVIEETKHESKPPPLVVTPNKHSYTFNLPDGWDFSFEQAHEHDARLLFFRAGAGFHESNSIIYVNEVQEKSSDAIEHVISNAKGQSPNLRVEAAPQISIPAVPGMSAQVRILTGSRDPRQAKEALAFIDDGKVTVLVVLTTKNTTNWGKDYEAFEAVVTGHRFFDCNTPNLAVPCR